jgi:hypothetical protein
MVENAMRRLALRQHELGRPLTREEREETLTSAPLEVARPVALVSALFWSCSCPSSPWRVWKENCSSRWR